MSDSEPPAPPVDRTLSVVGAFGWTMVVVLFTSLAVSISAAIRPGMTTELVNRQICFSLAFALTTLLVARMHLPTRDTFDALGARAVPWWVLGAGAVVGLLLQIPAQWADGQMLKWWPLSPEEQTRYELMFTFRSAGHKLAFAAAAALVGPISEEMFCRGALFRALRRSYGPALTVVISTGSFALLHFPDPRYTFNAALCGVVLGLLRLWSGTVWASLAAHVAYNTAIVVPVVGGWVNIGENSAPIGAIWGLLGAAGLAAALAGVYTLSRRSPQILEAVEADTD